MAAAAASARGRRRRSRAPAGGAAHAVGNDEEDEQHLDPFLDAAPSASSRVQFRNMASRARWVEETGAAEVVENRGKLWMTTGVTRAGKLYYNIEEIGFLVERGALILLGDKDETIGVKDIYEKLAGGNYGCTWDTFQAYKHLKSLGYILGRFGVPWTMTVAPRMSIVETDRSLNRVDGASNGITKLLKEMQTDGMNLISNLGSVLLVRSRLALAYFLSQNTIEISRNQLAFNQQNRPKSACFGLFTFIQSYAISRNQPISPCFEVYLPNSKFKKSSPGSPNFLLCLLR